jgi:hypothetical protein
MKTEYTEQNIQTIGIQLTTGYTSVLETGVVGGLMILVSINRVKSHSSM